MSAKFLEGVSGKLAEQWVATLLTPAFVFWAGGAAAALQRYGWTTLSSQFSQYPESLQIGLLVAALCLITASAFVVQRFDLPVLRWLEGYWPLWLRPLRHWLIRRAIRHSDQVSDRWQALARLDPTQLTPDQRDELIQLDWQQLHIPLPSQMMPTRLGNILRAAEQRPLEKYGLDAIVCWSRLWLLLPDAVKQDLTTTRTDLNAAARMWLWSLLFTLWSGVGALWAIPLGLLSALFAYRWAIAAAQTYGDLIEASFDLYRHLLYQSLRWQLPTNPNEERRVGQQLTTYLWRG